MDTVVEVILRTTTEDPTHSTLIFVTDDGKREEIALIPRDLSMFFLGGEFLMTHLADARKKADTLLWELIPSGSSQEKK